MVLIDNVGAFRQGWEAGERGRWFDTFQAIAGDGRQVGVHFVVSADRSAAVPTALSSVIQRRLILRLAGEMEYANLSTPQDLFDATSPPGRGFLEGFEVQVAVLGGTANTARQASAVAKLGEDLASGPAPSPSLRIERLPERVQLSDLPVEVHGQPVLGLADDTLGPLSFVPEGPLLVVGPPQSGKSSTLATIALAARRWQPGIPLAYLGAGRSPLRTFLPWDEAAEGADPVATMAKELADVLSSMQSPGRLPMVVIVEGLSEFLNTSADTPLQDLFRVCRDAGALVVAGSETGSMSSTWPLLQPVKAARHGIALQPDQIDGDAVFKTPFPRLSRAEFPPGRGLYVRGGRVVRVQCALPEVE